MDRIRIRGGNKLNGTIHISGAKNAALPLMITALLTPDTLTLKNVPRLVDALRLQRILQNHGVDITVAGKQPGQSATAGETLKISAKSIVDTTAPYELVSKMRASFWVLGPLLARCGEIRDVSNDAPHGRRYGGPCDHSCAKISVAAQPITSSRTRTGRKAKQAAAASALSSRVSIMSSFARSACRCSTSDAA